MRTPLMKQCPQCGKPFEARRKNQDYCSTECRTDFNNQVAKGRYATFKQQAPKVAGVQQELKKLKEYLATLTYAIEGIQEIDTKTISYQGKTYVREATVDRPAPGLGLNQGGGVMAPGGKIIYRRRNLSGSLRDYGRYTPEK